MKVKVMVFCFVVFTAIISKSTKKIRNNEEKERELSDNEGGAEQILDANDSTAIDNAAARMASLVDRVSRLKNKLQRELQTTVSYLRYHFNQRDVFDKRVMMQHLSSIIPGSSGERRLLEDSKDQTTVEQAMLKNYGKIEAETKIGNFETVKTPVENNNISDSNTTNQKENK